jgi:cellulose synthase/poly-beta-1,6-N-acetylglucosamine synthase-like glycosyltransferase
MTLLNEQITELTWIGPAPGDNKRLALLVPQFNEGSHCNIQSRLRYFTTIATSFSDQMDVILIDDGSTDNSLDSIRLFLEQNNYPFFLAAISPNANKVGALNLTALAISHEFILLSDFDTDIVGYDIIIRSLDALKDDPASMGLYFRMLPYEGNNQVFAFQQLEYATLRSLYKLYARDGNVPVMPGAGACYKRACLLAIYEEHSGLRSGEDREATMIGLKLAYKTHYIGDVLILTRPPLLFSTLVKQRVRWNLGYLETYHKESAYYAQQVRKLTRIGMVFLLDALAVIFMVLLPAIGLCLGLVSLHLLVTFVLITYLSGILLCVSALLISPKEFVEIRKKLIVSILLYPVFKFTIGYFSWRRAIAMFLKKLWAPSPKVRQTKLQTS